MCLTLQSILTSARPRVAPPAAGRAESADARRRDGDREVMIGQVEFLAVEREGFIKNYFE
jgi:hypothetical protein